MKILALILSAMVGVLCLAGIAQSTPVVRVRACSAHAAAPVVIVAPHAAATYVTPSVAHDYPAVSPDYYYSLQNYYRDKLLVDAVAGRVVDLISKGIITPRPTPTPPVVPAPPVGPLPPAPPVGALLPASDRLKAIVETSCLKCHSGAKAGGGLAMDNLDALDALTRYRMWAQTFTGAMPKGGAALPDADSNEFQDWAMGKLAAAK